VQRLRERWSFGRKLTDSGGPLAENHHGSPLIDGLKRFVPLCCSPSLAQAVFAFVDSSLSTPCAASTTFFTVR
jgi:hypothetical protein